MFRVRRGRPAWAVSVLLFLAVVIVAALAFNLANLDTGGEALPAIPNAGGTPPSGVGSLAPDPYSNVFLLLLAGFLVFGGLILLFRRRARVKRQMTPISWWDLLSYAMGLVVVLVLLVAWPRAIAALKGGANATNPSGTGSGNSAGWPLASGAPVGLFLAVTVFGAILILAYFLRRGAGASSLDSEEDDDGPNARAEAADAVQTAIADLELGGDVRTVVLACFQRFCVLLGARGITAQLALTPRELEGLAVARLGVAPDASETLTSLFEEARYSEHPLGEEARGRAIDSLSRIQSMLEA